ncbi:MAG: energy-converting hydrogenase A subunit M [Glaciecola sp.]
MVKVGRCLRYGIDISERKTYGAAIDALLAAELYIKLHKTDEQPLKKTPQRKSQAQPTAFPIPRAYKVEISGESVQLNFCKNPNCNNYGVPAKNPGKSGDGKIRRGLGNDYKFTTTKIGRVLTCKLCGTSTKLINNKAHFLESNRNKETFKSKMICCPDTKLKTSRRRTRACRNSDVCLISNPKRYTLRGKVKSTISGLIPRHSQRVECNACHNPFHVPLNAEFGQELSHLNAALFRKFVNKGVMNRLQEMVGVSMPVLYERIEFFYNQCIAFDQWHINENIHTLKDKNLEISMDRQHYLSNWNDKKDTRPTKLVNTSSVENKSRYVFASTLNFDMTSDWDAIKKDAKKRRDSAKPEHKRRYPQYIINDAEIESDDVKDDLALKTPSNHLLVQQTYSLMAHLEVMKPFYESASRSCLFADDDEGFELGICLVLKDVIEQAKLYPVLIRADRNNASQMQDKRTWSEQVLQKYGVTMRDIDKANPEKLREISQKYWAATIHQQSIKSGSAKSEWLVHPFPKAKHMVHIKPLVGIGREVTLTIADTLLDVSTPGVDNYFQMIRRRINVLERPITTATNGKRWNGYACYNPKWAVMLIEILRVYNNYVLTDEKSLKNKGLSFTPRTPAQKIGFADQKYRIEDILDFTLISKAIAQR